MASELAADESKINEPRFSGIHCQYDAQKKINKYNILYLHEFTNTKHQNEIFPCQYDANFIQNNMNWFLEYSTKTKTDLL